MRVFIVVVHAVGVLDRGQCFSLKGSFRERQPSKRT